MMHTDGTDTGSSENTASHSRQTVSIDKHSNGHNDQEYGIIYYLQGGDM